MQKFLIERTVPGAGSLSGTELEAMSRRSNEVLRSLGPEIRWLESYISDDRITCIYEATSERLLREHAIRGGFPVNRIEEIRAVISPATAMGPAA